MSDPGDPPLTRSLPPAPARGTILAGKYRVDSVVGHGGMGVIVAAEHISLGGTVAIKLLVKSEAFRESIAARFLREAQAAARLQSEHVVKIHDVGSLESGEPFIVMEMLRGADLQQVLRDRGPQSSALTVEYVLQACDAIAEAHEYGIVHRDLKPSNLFVLRRSDGRPHVKVLDFGISKAATVGPASSSGGDLTRTQSMLGSPYYMSPEQLRDSKNVDARSDIWSLGVILYELLTGDPPFKHDSFSAVCAAITIDRPPSLRERRPDVSEVLEAIILRCLEKEPERRFQSVGELVRALEPLAGRIGSVSTIPVFGSSTMKSSPRPVDDKTVSYEEAGAVNPGTGSQMGVAASEPTLAAAGIAQRRTSPALFVAVLLGVAVATFVVLRLGTPGEAAKEPAIASAVPPPVPASRSFSLSLESQPTGAEVFEGELRLGTTPLRLSIDEESVRVRPRTLVLRHAGYQPYTIVQGRSSESVRLDAALVPQAAVAAPLAAASSPAPAGRGAPATAPPAGSKPAARASAAPPDIRLSR